jgi:hypothetical protein
MNRNVSLAQLVWVSPLVAAPASAQQKPNVVFILADNVGYGDLGPYDGGELRGTSAGPEVAYVVKLGKLTGGVHHHAPGRRADDPTWKNAPGIPISGGGLWTSYTLDPKTGLLYLPGGNPAPDFATRQSFR